MLTILQLYQHGRRQLVLTYPYGKPKTTLQKFHKTKIKSAISITKVSQKEPKDLESLDLRKLNFLLLQKGQSRQETKQE